MPEASKPRRGRPPKAEAEKVARVRLDTSIDPEVKAAGDSDGRTWNAILRAALLG